MTGGSERLEEIRAAALSLPDDDRAHLAEELARSLPDHVPDFDPEIRREWLELARARLEKIRSGEPTRNPAEAFEAIDRKIEKAQES